MSDVARHAGVAPQTVSRTLRTPHLVSSETFERVQRSIAATGYVPNLTASSLASNRSMTVAAIIPAISTSIFADVLHGLDEVLSPQGYNLFIGSTDYDPAREEELTRTFLGRRPDGFFIVGTAHTEATTHLLRQSAIPVVEGWSLTQNPIGSVVGFSNVEAIRAITKAVVEKGYRHPTFAGSIWEGDTRAVERSRSFELAVREFLPDEPVRIVNAGAREVEFETGRELSRRVLAEHPETDVVMFSSDIFAAGALFEFQHEGIAVPGQLAITGFGDFEIARHVSPALTTVAIPNRAIGTEAGRILLASMSDREFAPQRLDVGFEVMLRESA
jgi:LacI family gluconate utilization system Gnt-I transcriptional repressor